MTLGTWLTERLGHSLRMESPSPSISLNLGPVIQWAQELKELCSTCAPTEAVHMPIHRIRRHLWDLKFTKGLCVDEMQKTEKQLEHDRVTLFTGGNGSPNPIRSAKIADFYYAAGNYHVCKSLMDDALPAAEASEMQDLLRLLFRVRKRAEKWSKVVSKQALPNGSSNPLRQEQDLHDFIQRMHHKQFDEESLSRLTDLCYRCERLARLFYVCSPTQLREVNRPLGTSTTSDEKEFFDASYPYIVCLNDIHRTWCFSSRDPDILRMTYKQLRERIMLCGQRWLASNVSKPEDIEMVLGFDNGRYLFNPECISILWIKEDPEVTTEELTSTSSKYRPNLEFWNEHSYLWLLHNGSAKQDKIVARLVSLAWLELVFRNRSGLLTKVSAWLGRLISSDSPENDGNRGLVVQNVYASLVPSLWFVVCEYALDLKLLHALNVRIECLMDPKQCYPYFADD